jgi:four helix bundle protein
MPDFNRQAHLQKRTKQFALRVIHMTNSLPHKPESWVISKQILRSSMSIAANYRAVARARSRADFVSKMGVVLEEADETLFWLEMICEAELASSERLKLLAQEATELVAIFASSYQTARR